MALTSFIVFIPLGWLYLNQPLVLQYVSQSSIADRIAANPELTWGGQLLTSLRVYLDGSVALWQGQWQQIVTFDWLIFVGFWIGLMVVVARWQRPAYLFLLTGLVVLWIPVLLNDIDFSDLRLPDMLPVHHAISHLRAAGILPLYYVTVAAGLLGAAEWMGKKLSIRKPEFVGLATFLIIFGLSGLLNSYTFFVRWPQEPFLYERYNGHELDLAQALARESSDKDILIPFHLYSHPTLRMVLDEIFTESDTPPPSQPSRPAILVTASDAPLASYVWLSRSASEEGMAFLTLPLQSTDLLNLSLPEPQQGFDFAAPYFITAQTNPIPNLTPIQAQLAAWPVPNPVNYTWDNEIRLVGYEVAPQQTEPGQPATLTLYWENLTDQPLLRDVFIHAINSSGEGVNQVDNVMLTDGHYRRQGKITPTHHLIQLGDELPAGPYLIRLGLFNTRTGNRVPITGDNDQILGDEVKLGLFYIGNQGLPDKSIEVALGDQLQLAGYTLPNEYPVGTGETVINPQLYWQALKQVDEDYTIFVQLLDNNNQFIAGFDTQPLQGHYPTSLWQPGERVIQEINLTLPAELPSGSYRLVTGMYNLDTGRRLSAADKQGNPLADNMVMLANVIITTNRIAFEVP